VRPVQRKTSTTTFTRHKQAFLSLGESLGRYCSYCEVELKTNLAVEHLQPKSLNPHLAVVWDNFLLACTNCNSTKKDKPIVLDDYFWADRDNTARAFEYSIGGSIRVNLTLDLDQQARAQRTIELFGLNKRSTASDSRWSSRREIWDMATDSRQDLSDCDTLQMRQQIVRTAKGQGFWSVWMTVFKDDPDMLERFIKEFPGTAVNCFDPVTFQPVPRVNGAI
jgi:uncharacterized protein (TIGR02646 family)